jgi:DNA polymerase-3 subunit epsilon
LGSREDAIALNCVYLSALGRIANEDGVVTPEERADLESVAAMLGLAPEDVDAAVETSTDSSAEAFSLSGRHARRAIWAFPLLATTPT